MVEFCVPNFKTLLVDELKNYKEWVMLTLTDLKMAKTQRKTDDTLALSLREFTLVDLLLPVHNQLMGRKKALQDY